MEYTANYNYVLCEPCLFASLLALSQQRLLPRSSGCPIEILESKSNSTFPLQLEIDTLNPEHTPTHPLTQPSATSSDDFSSITDDRFAFTPLAPVSTHRVPSYTSPSTNETTLFPSNIRCIPIQTSSDEPQLQTTTAMSYLKSRRFHF